jgi:cytochrome P450
VTTAQSPGAPGPTGIRYLPAFGRDPAEFLLQTMHRYGDVVFFRSGPLRGYLIFHPEDIKYVLEDNIDNYGHGQWLVDKVRATLGTSLFTLDGEAWRRRRQLLDPEFERRRVVRFAGVITANTNTMIESWARSGSTVDIVAELEELNRNNSGEAIFGRDWRANAGILGSARPLFIAQSGRQLNSPLGLIPLRVPIPFHRRFMSARTQYDAVVAALIARRRAGGREADDDLLSMLVALRDPKTGEQMSDLAIRDQATNFFFLWKPVAITLTRVCWLLAQHPDVLERMRQEITQVADGRPPTVDDISSLQHTSNVIAEVLRLYPPGILQPREANAADEIGGYPIPGGTRVVMCAFATHRHPEFWDAPDEFRPDRFSDRSVVKHPYAYSPLGEPGPRRCLGYEVAHIELALVIAAIAQRFRLRLAEGTAVKTSMGVAQDFTAPIRVRVEPV